MKVWFERRQELTPGIWQYWFRPERKPDFVPGQYVDLYLNGVAEDPRGAARTFSLTSLPDDDSISFVLKHFELQSPYKHTLRRLQAGDEARIDDAMGDVVLPKSPDIPLVFVAGGIGLASFASIFKDLLKRRQERQIFLFYALRARREQIFQELTDAYPLASKDIIIAPNRLSAEHLQASTPPEALVYLSGSQRFVEGLRDDLARLGTPHEQIIFDYFDGYSEL